MSTFRVAGAQIENSVGDISGNARRIAEAMEWAEEQGADAVVFPELALTGYPLGDLVLRSEFLDGARYAIEDLARRSGRTTAIVGTVNRVAPRRAWDTRERDLAISAAVLCDGELRGFYDKSLLPSYGVFEETRNFVGGDDPDRLWRIGETIAGISICEDLWSGDGPPEAQAAAGAQVFLVPNASPWHREKPGGRLELAASVARRNGVPVIYVNSVGGQDELVFDGGSLIVDADGELVHRCGQFEPENFVVDLELDDRPLNAEPATVHTRPRPAREPIPRPTTAPETDEVAQARRALVLGTRDFARRNGMGGATLILTGGIDSAVTAAIAAEAFGPESVLAVAMHTAADYEEPLADARDLAGKLGIQFEEVAVDTALAEFERDLSPIVELRAARGTRDALESRVRAALLYASADELGYLALATINKSELSIGSAALFGDIIGDFAPLKDTPKTLLYRIAEEMNRERPLINERILGRRQGMGRATDVTLPPFEVIDDIVRRYLEGGEDPLQIIEAGFETETVRGILQLIDDAEFKRRHAPPGVKITSRAFGQDLRMPISNLWRPFRREEAEMVGEDPAAALQRADVSRWTPTGRKATPVDPDDEELLELDELGRQERAG